MITNEPDFSFLKYLKIFFVGMDEEIPDNRQNKLAIICGFGAKNLC